MTQLDLLTRKKSIEITRKIIPVISIQKGVHLDVFKMIATTKAVEFKQLIWDRISSETRKDHLKEMYEHLGVLGDKDAFSFLLQASYSGRFSESFNNGFLALVEQVISESESLM